MQVVDLKNIAYDELRIDRGVPRGTVLCPLIFNIYINDMYTYADSNTQLWQYAGDTLILQTDEILE